MCRSRYGQAITAEPTRYALASLTGMVTVACMRELDVILVRHSEPGGVATGTFLGHTDPTLGADGLLQADLVANAVVSRMGAPPAQIVASPLQRAMQSAEPIAAAWGASITPIAALKEINFGDWDGVAPAEREARWPGAGQAWIRGPIDRAAPNGESLRMVSLRVSEWLEGLRLDAPRGPVVVVAHFGSLACLAALLLGMPIERAVDLRLARGEAGRIEHGVLRWWGVHG